MGLEIDEGFLGRVCGAGLRANLSEGVLVRWGGVEVEGLKWTAFRIRRGEGRKIELW